MRDRLVVTITDVNGSKHFNVHQIVKKILLYTVLFVGFVIVVGAMSIDYLIDEVETIENKRDKIEADYKKMVHDIETEYRAMVEKNDDLMQDIQLKTDELITISDKIEDLEDIIGIGQEDDQNRSLTERMDLAKITGAMKSVVLQIIPNGAPVSYKRVTSSYGNRMHPILKRQEFHTGIDVNAKMNTPVYAPADGVVDYARNSHKVGYGRLLTLNHSLGFKTLYGHLNEIVVKRGEFVKKGQLVAYTGNSGLSNGPHLHYEIRFIGSHMNPKLFMDWNMKNFTAIFEKEKKVQWQSLLKTINRLMEIQAPLSLRQAQKSTARSKSSVTSTSTENSKARSVLKTSSPSVKAGSLAAKSSPQN